ncbi:RNA polymerase sigma factor [Edaphobacter aggregans]|uniref:RNA polymerase sigma factor n=1 Tax=Edaphobacter aggregans TaxID=570835 RepID=UPI00316ADC24
MFKFIKRWGRQRGSCGDGSSDLLKEPPELGSGCYQLHSWLARRVSPCVFCVARNHAGADQTDATGIEYFDGLYGYALVLSRNHAEAEDLVQGTYLRAVQAMGRLRADSNMKGWLFTILRNVWLNQLK